jgi:hypothetical protein
MVSRALLRSVALTSFCLLFAGAYPAAAGHARIVRLSLVQGDVRLTRDSHGDPLTDPKAAWETAVLNLPIRQGYVLATDNGRAEVEFENGATAFLSENTVLEFYDLSLQDGARTTRLVLRQGTASFYVNPADDDYFSVTGGDFTVEATSRTEFRLDNYDDGSAVDVLQGRVSALHKGNTTPLEKGQSLSMKAGDDTLNTGRLSENDEFDRWVSGRIDSVTTATNAALQYTSSPSYASGFGDLNTYGSWFSCGGSGYGWRPFGAGAAWSPFTMGQWIWDPGFGWTWISSEPWGWAPYHYGGWLFDTSCGGWFYSPPVFFKNPGNVIPKKRFPPIIHPPRPLYRAATAVFVRQNGKTGLVPMHPVDQKGKTPLNLEYGVFPTALVAGAGEPFAPGERGQKLETLRTLPREAMSGGLVATTPPVRVSRTVLTGDSGTRAISFSKDSSIAYDPREHRFVNTNPSPAASSAAADGKETRTGNRPIGAAAAAGSSDAPRGSLASTFSAVGARVPVSSSGSRSATSPAARTTTPPPAPRVSGGERGGYQAGSAHGSAGTSSGSASHASSSHAASSGRPH